VAFFDEDQVAGLKGRPYTSAWRTYAFLKTLEAVRTPGEVQELLKARGIRWVVSTGPQAWFAAKYAPAAGLIGVCGEMALENGDHAAYRISARCSGASAAEIGRWYFEDAPVVEPGSFDDISPALRYSGRWLHDHQFPEASGHTITYSLNPVDFVQLKFRGSRVRILYTAAANRGEAEVSIDGHVVGRLDQRSAETRWQASAVFTAAAAGDHTVRVSLPSDIAAGAYVDIDGFVVE
jgi:hypothetical protein